LERKQLYIVDDEPSILEALSAALSSQYETMAFASGIEALTSAHTRPPDVLVTDLNMPQMNGFELIYAIRQLCPACRVVLMSGNIVVPEPESSTEHTGTRFLAKPFATSTLLRIIASL
jgi:DNA-binding NtrC family response regulator